MKVFNPGQVPVVVDDGVVVPASEHADIADGPAARVAVAGGRLLDQTAPADDADAVADNKARRAPKEA